MNTRTTIRFDVYCKNLNIPWYLYAGGYKDQESAKLVVDHLRSMNEPREAKVVERTIVETSVDVYP